MSDDIFPTNPELEGEAGRLPGRHDLQQERPASEDSFRSLFAVAPIGMAQADPATGQWLRVNPKLCAITGYSAEEMRQMRVPEITHPDDRQRERDACQRVIRGEATHYSLEKRCVRKDGRVVWVNENMTAVRDDAGQPVRLVATIEDITERKQAETAQAQYASLLNTIIKCASEAIFAKDIAGKYVAVSEAGARMVGHTAAGMIGRTDQELLPAEIALEFRKTDETVIASGQDCAREEIGVIDGKKHYFLTHKTAWRDASGKIIGVIGVTNDITAHKMVEAALREREEQLRLFVQHSPAALAMFDREMRYLVVSHRWTEDYRLGEQSLIGRCHYDVFPELPQRYKEDHQRCLAGMEEQKSEEDSFVRLDGSVDWIRWELRPWRHADGLIGGIIMLTEVITKRKLAEEAHARLATVVEQAAEIIVITDISGTIIYANPSFERVTGYTSAEVVGQNPRILKSGKQDVEFYRKMWEVLKRGEVWRGHFINRRKDGTLFEEEANISPVRDASGKVVNYVAVKRDVTHEVELERQLRQSQKMEGIGQLAGGVAHDFNNILSSMLLQTELMAMEKNLSNEIQEGLRQFRTDANRAANLTRQLLLFSRRQVMQVRDLDLNDVVMNLVKMLQRIIGEDVQLQLNLHPTPLHTHADAGMIDQVLMNLAVNARDAMPQGGRLTIETSAVAVDEALAGFHADARPGQFVCISVSDTGSGIPTSVLPHVFEPFFTTKEVGKGTGLGLATVFGIVKQHRGWIKLDNRPGQGLTFQVFLPACAAAVEEPTPTVSPQKTFGGTETILLVEDEPAVRTPLSFMLKRHGYQVLAAANGNEALQLWAANRQTVNLLLTDLVMPGGVSGQELARRLESEQPALKVVFMSGYSSDVAGHELQLGQGENYIQKPFATNRLLETIRACLDA